MQSCVCVCVSAHMQMRRELTPSLAEYSEGRRALKETKIRFQTLYPACLRVHYEDGKTTYDMVKEATSDMASLGPLVKVIESRSFKEKLQEFTHSSLDNTD